MSSLNVKVRLPHHLYYESIIPYLFSQYLHQLIVYDTAQEWNPFIHLPLLSKEFHQSCQLLVRRIFDISPAEKEKETEIALRLLRSTRELWQEARRLPLHRRPKKLAIPSEFAKLMSSHSVIQIYICAGYAKYYYTADVLNWICLDRLWITAGSETTVPRGFQPRQFVMVEKRMHRLFLPFQCAIKLCDLIHDDLLAGPIADYLAKKAVTYGTEPFLLKCAQDLEMFMARRITIPSDVWNTLTTDTLRLIDNLCLNFDPRRNILSDLQECGELVSKYRRPSQIGHDSIINTRVFDTLDATVLADWGENTGEILKRTKVITDNLLDVLYSPAGELEEYDEYFEQDGERISFSQTWL